MLLGLCRCEVLQDLLGLWFEKEKDGRNQEFSKRDVWGCGHREPQDNSPRMELERPEGKLGWGRGGTYWSGFEELRVVTALTRL